MPSSPGTSVVIIVWPDVCVRADIRGPTPMLSFNDDRQTPSRTLGRSTEPPTETVLETAVMLRSCRESLMSRSAPPNLGAGVGSALEQQILFRSRRLCGTQAA
jgi:hypothetical protein